MAVLTDECQADEERDAEDEADDVEEEVLVIVDSDAGVDPWTVAAKCEQSNHSVQDERCNILVLPRHATSASPAMLAP